MRRKWVFKVACGWVGWVDIVCASVYPVCVSIVCLHVVKDVSMLGVADMLF